MIRIASLAVAMLAVTASVAAGHSTRQHYLKIATARGITENRAVQQRTKTAGGPWRSTVGTCKRKSGTRVTCTYTLDHIAYTPSPTMTVCKGRVAVRLRRHGRITSKLTQKPCGPAR